MPFFSITSALLNILLCGSFFIKDISLIHFLLLANSLLVFVFGLLLGGSTMRSISDRLNAIGFFKYLINTKTNLGNISFNKMPPRSFSLSSLLQNLWLLLLLSILSYYACFHPLGIAALLFILFNILFRFADNQTILYNSSFSALLLFALQLIAIHLIYLQLLMDIFCLLSLPLSWSILYHIFSQDHHIKFEKFLFSILIDSYLA